MKLVQRLAILGFTILALGSASAQNQNGQGRPIPVKVVVVTTFEIGDDITGIGEFQAWAANLPLPKVIPFPQGYHPLRYNPDLQVLGMVTGEGKSHAAASIMGLGMDPRFDLSKAYWIVAAIAGIDPNKGSVGSVAWAKYVIDADLAFEIDAREIPAGWTTGYIPFARTAPYQQPFQPLNSNFVQQGYQLNAGLVDWAFGLTQNITLPDDSMLQQVRAGYPTYPNALRPPFVLEGDDLAGDTFWIGDLLNTWAENWVAYWAAGPGNTSGPGSFAMSDFEDVGVGQALLFLSQVGRADQNRFLVLRAASDYTVQPQGQTPAQFQAGESTGTGLSGFTESLADVYQVGSVVVKKISSGWAKYRDTIPSPSNP